MQRRLNEYSDTAAGCLGNWLFVFLVVCLALLGVISYFAKDMPLTKERPPVCVPLYDQTGLECCK